MLQLIVKSLGHPIPEKAGRDEPASCYGRLAGPHHTGDDFRGKVHARAPFSCNALCVSELGPAKPPAVGYRNHRKIWGVMIESRKTSLSTAISSF